MGLDKSVAKVAGVWKQPRGGSNQPKVSQQAERDLQKAERQHQRGLKK